MKRLAQTLSVAALVAILVPACLFFADRMPLASMQHWLLGATALWFIATPLWMEHKATD